MLKKKDNEWHFYFMQTLFIHSFISTHANVSLLISKPALEICYISVQFWPKKYTLH